MINLIKSAWKLVRENWKAYIVINAVYYGLVIICMIYVAFNQKLQGALLKQVGASFTTGPLAFVGRSYASAQVAQAILVTFCVNLFLGSVAEITLPSLIIPFSGLLMGIFRAALWGLLLSPAYPDLRLVMISPLAHLADRRTGLYPGLIGDLHSRPRFSLSQNS